MRNSVSQRYSVAEGWPSGGMVSRPVGVRFYDVQQFTGYPVSTVRGGQWFRGILLRKGSPRLNPERLPVMYDPTNPATWPGNTAAHYTG